MSPFQMWIEIAGVLCAGAAVAVVVMRTSEARPKAARWKVPERIDKRLEEILSPREAPMTEPSRRGMGWKQASEEPVVVAGEEEKAEERASSRVSVSFLLEERENRSGERAIESDGMAQRLGEPQAVYSHDKQYF
ncbi:MAG: hypothetical protein ACP5M4_13635 [Acidobacteriaceae bacterium]